MFVGEAPGRLGADASEIPFHGDKSGHNFESLLATAGLDRYRTFVTNAALCNPRDEHGNNATPSPSELKNCSEHLKRQIDLVNPEVIVTLGAKALEAMNNIDPHGLKLASSVRKAVWWYGRQLVPLYHPGQRAMIHRSFATQLSDYYFVAELLRRRRGRPMTQKNLMKFETRHVVSQIFALLPRLSYFALHKMFYLIEYHSVKERGERFTGAYMVRQKEGPYCVDLALANISRQFPHIRIRRLAGVLTIETIGKGEYFDLLTPLQKRTSDIEIDPIVARVVAKFGAYSDAQLKTYVYLTKPMKRILREELRYRRNMLNAPINFDGVYAHKGK